MKQPSGFPANRWTVGWLLAVLLAVLLTGCTTAAPAVGTSARPMARSLRGELFLVVTGPADPTAPQDAGDYDAGPLSDEEFDTAQEEDGGFTEPGFDGSDPPERNPDELPAPLLSPVDESAPEYGPTPPGEEEGLEVHGSLSARYIRRSTGGQHDDQLYSFLTLDVGDASKHAQTFHMDGRVSRNLSSDNREFGGLEDSYSGSTQWTLYNAFVDFHDAGAELLRVGRQTDYDTPEVVYYDGVHVRTDAMGDLDSRIGAYGGVSNHQYESSTSGDRVYGLYLESRPWDGGRVRFDWLHADDDRTLGNFHDDLLSVAAWQAFDQLRLEGSFSRFEDDNRDYRLASTWFDPEEDLLIRGSFYSLLETQSTSAIEFDDLTTPLQDLYPYRQVDVSAAHGVAKDVSLQGGASIRVVDDSSDKGEFNRDVNRYFLTAAFDKVGSEDNIVSVTAEHWQGDRNENQAFGMDLTREMSDQLQASLGTYYSLYKIDSSGQSEREDVQTYYMRFDYEFSKAYSLDFGYEFEDSDVGNFHNIRMAAQWRF